jgi:oxygen-independent coproporphyrinogen-3 oxidase
MDPLVQEAIHRVQPKENVSNVMQWARNIGYTSVNLDLVYGLPKQSLNSVKKTFDDVLEWKPDRIAFYSYAHVPWVKPGMRKFTETDLPNPEVKRSLYAYGREQLEKNGYREVGMDHFALNSDPLFSCFENKTLNRNFMGYTTTQAQLLIGLGVSAISDAFNAFVQNQKTVEEYSSSISSKNFAHFKGHLLTDSESNIRHHIRQLMCHFETRWAPKEAIASSIKMNFALLKEMENDGLLILQEGVLVVTNQGKGFVRNICMAIDPLIKSETISVFSQTV